MFKKFNEFNSYVGRDYDDYFKQVREGYKEIDNPFWYYEKLINDLLDIQDVELLPLKEFVKKDNTGKKQIALRHDIDADPITAVKCARALSRVGISGSFYFLHSAVYYGEFFDNVFVRNSKLQDWIKQIVIAGSEIGMHNDAIGLSQQKNIDGIKHLKEEINWFKMIGTRIYGTVAHNNFLINSAENYEIFNEYKLYSRSWLDERYNNIGKTNLEELELSYEGTFAKVKSNITKKDAKKYLEQYKDSGSMSNKEWTYKYFFDNPVNDWSCNTQIWLVGKNKWIIASKINDKIIFEFHVPLSKIIQFIKDDIEVSSSILMVLHPEYFGGK
jgi:hypothetical protein